MRGAVDGGYTRPMTRIAAALLGLCLAGTIVTPAFAEEPSLAKRSAYAAGAVVANVTPLSTAYAPRCLMGYVLCKFLFASASIVAAGDQLFFSGGGDMAQTRAILLRGFSGDWVITPRHIAGDAKPEVLPDPPPPTGGEGGGKGGFEPPPI